MNANDSRVHLRLPAVLVAWLKEYSERHGITISQLIRRLIIEHVREEDRKMLEEEARQI